MKNISIYSYYRALTVAVFLILYALNGFSQSTNYNCYLKNITQVDPKTLTFEIWIENTGTDTLYLMFFQAGINFNYAGLSNGGTITGAFVAGSADSTLRLNQQFPNWDINQTSKQIRIAGILELSPPLTINGPASIPAPGGIRIGKFIMTNTVNFAPATPDFAWSYLPSTSTVTQTALACYVNSSSAGTNITNPSHQIIQGNPLINALAIPTLSQWGLIAFSILLLCSGVLFLRKII